MPGTMYSRTVRDSLISRQDAGAEYRVTRTWYTGEAGPVVHAGHVAATSIIFGPYFTTFATFGVYMYLNPPSIADNICGAECANWGDSTTNPPPSSMKYV